MFYILAAAAGNMLYVFCCIFIYACVFPAAYQVLLNIKQ